MGSMNRISALECNYIFTRWQVLSYLGRCLASVGQALDRFLEVCLRLAIRLERRSCISVGSGGVGIGCVNISDIDILLGKTYGDFSSRVCVICVVLL